MERTTQRKRWAMILSLIFIAALGTSRTALSQPSEQQRSKPSPTRAQDSSGRSSRLAALPAEPSPAPAKSAPTPESGTRSRRGLFLDKKEVQDFYNAIYTVFGIGSVLLGALVGWILASKLNVSQAENPAAKFKARRHFRLYLGFFGVMWVLAYLLAVYGYDYFGHIIKLVVELQFFLATLLCIALFVIAAALVTRFFPRSRCPNVLIPF